MLQIAKNLLQGNSWENLVEKSLLSGRLRYNFETQQAHGARRPDFSIHDNNGVRKAFVEVKSGKQAGAHDFQQTLANIVLTRDNAGAKQLHIVAVSGQKFFSPAQHAAIRQTAGKDVKVMIWKPSQIKTMTATIAKTVTPAASRAVVKNAAGGRPALPTRTVAKDPRKLPQEVAKPVVRRGGFRPKGSFGR